MFISSYLNLFLACTAALMASTPDVYCNAANLRSSGAKPDAEEDLIEGPLGIMDEDTSFWGGSKHRYPSKHSSHGGYGHRPHRYPPKHSSHGGYGHRPHRYPPKHSSHGGYGQHHCPHGYKKKCKYFHNTLNPSCRCVRSHHWADVELNEDFQGSEW